MNETQKIQYILQNKIYLHYTNILYIVDYIETQHGVTPLDKEKYLGEFEQVILLAIMRLGSDAYGKTIRELLAELLNRDVTVGALYATLERLETKGMVSGTMGEPTKERGGRAKKYFEVTAKGHHALKRSKEALTLMWQDLSLRTGLPHFADSPGLSALNGVKQ